MARFADRREAGQFLAQMLAEDRHQFDVVVALPRGGLMVAEPIGARLGCPVIAFPVRKIGAPLHPEWAIGAIALGGVQLCDEDALRTLGMTRTEWQRLVSSEEQVIEQYISEFGRIDRLSGKRALLVDDGLATGFTARAAIRAIRALGALRVALAVPIGSSRTISAIESEEGCPVLCGYVPESFQAVSQAYQDFRPLAIHEVQRCVSSQAAKVHPAHLD
jgi:putative phosphoribosyl transferase